MVYFNGLRPPLLENDFIDGRVTFTSAQQVEIPDSLLRRHEIQGRTFNVQGAGILETTGVGPPPPERTMPRPNGPTFSHIQPNAVNVETGRNQCFPMSMANSLHYLENRHELPIPNDHTAGEPGDDSLVTALDQASNRSVTSRTMGDGVFSVPMVDGKFEYLEDNDMEDVLDHSHQGRGYGGAGNELPAGDYTSSGITSENEGDTITFDWICEQVQCGADIELAYTRHDAANNIIGAHVVRVFGCGITNGRPWLRYLHDSVQGNDTIGLETAEVTIRDIDGDGTLNFGSRGSEISYVMSEKINQKGLDDFNTPSPITQAFTNGATFVRDEFVPGLINTAFGIYNSLRGSNGQLVGELSTKNGSKSLFVPGVTVSVNGRESPVFFANENQINFMTPWETEPGVASVLIEVDGLPSAVFGVEISSAAPGIFMIDPGAAQPRGVIRNQDGSINLADNGTAAGDRVVVYAVGLGAVTNPAPTGEPAPDSPLSRVVEMVTATIGGESAVVEFAGLTPRFHGLYQVNMVVPAGLAPGDYELVLLVDGVTSNAVLITIS